MRLVGYSDRWSVRRGESIRFFVSSEASRFDVQLVRLIHGDENPRGPGVKTVALPSTVNGSYGGAPQAIHTGSYVTIAPPLELCGTSGFTAVVWLQATAPERGEQGVISQWDHGTQRGFSLFIDGTTGRLAGRLATGDGTIATVASQRPLRRQAWYFAALSVDPRDKRLTLSTEVLDPTVFDLAREIVATPLPLGAAFATDEPLLLAAGCIIESAGRRHAAGCFNGKLSSPAILGRALSAQDVANVDLADLGDLPAEQWLARWDFSHQPSGRLIPDTAGGRREGVAVNRPTRAVTGHNWRAKTDSFLEAPSEYNAIHFHDDDLEDAGWEESFRFLVPAELSSGVYAMKLSAEGGASDCLPFFVRPPTGKPEAAVAVLLPTLSYLAYSNSTLDPEPFEFLASLCPLRNMRVQLAEFGYIEKSWLKSTYNNHRDGSGICHVTMLRPSLTSMRPNHRGRLNDSPHQLAADLHLIDWLEAKRIPYDVITDHDLHLEGAALLESYTAVLSGTHAEYWSVEMLEGLESYQQQGGRFIYLSGNGLYWVTALDPETQTVCEVRRANGTRAWQAQPGEARLSFTGEPGGIWACRGRAPQRYVGVGFAAQGFDRGVHYKRTPASNDPRCSFIFSGITDELIGNFPTLVMNYGAAGYEVDRADVALGTPPHALVVAHSARLSDSYQFVVEGLPATMPNQGGLTNPNVRADMVFYETPAGGAVFSVGSISFCSALSYNGYENNVSRLLENVVRTFADPGPLPGRRE
jgi:N,N-dimethylformamidase